MDNFKLDKTQKEFIEKEKNKSKKDEKPKKKSFTILAKVLVPTIAKYKVIAETEHEAAKMVRDGKVAPYYIALPKITTHSLLELAVFISGSISKLLTIKIK